MTTYNDEDVFSPDNQDSKLTLRSDNELFNEEESNIIHPVINVKRIKTSKSEDWQIIINGKKMVLLKGNRFNNNEREYLRTVDGMKFLITEYKNGKKSICKIKEELKKVLEP